MQKQTKKAGCSIIRDNLFNYQENKLPETAVHEFEDHLHSCRECADIVAGFNSVTSIIDRKKAEEPNPFMQTRILQRMESILEKENIRPVSLYLRVLRPISVSLILLIAVYTGFSLAKQKHANFSDINNHQKSIQGIKSGLNIPDFIDEDKSFFEYH